MEHSSPLHEQENGLSKVQVHRKKIPTPSFRLPAVYTKLNKGEEVPYPLTIQEAHQFLENVLGLKDFNERIKVDRLSFLNDFAQRMSTEITFSNINQVFPDPLLNKKPPSLQECKESILKGWGGTCIYINMFSRALLDILGFKTHHISGGNPGDPMHDTHCSTVVCDATYPGSRHIVEVGTVRPIYQAISIDFEEESPIYEFSGMTFKFFKRDHGIVLSCSLVPKPPKKTLNIFECRGKFWKTDLLYWSDINRSRAYFTERIKYRCVYPTVLPMVCETIGFYSRRYDNCFLLGSHGDLFLRKNYGQERDALQFLSEEEWLNSVAKEFPQYPRETVVQVLQNVRCLRKRHNYHLPSLM